MNGIACFRVLVCGLAVVVGLCGCGGAPTWSTGGGYGSGATSYRVEDGSYISYALQWHSANDGQVYFVIVGGGCTGSGWWDDNRPPDVRKGQGVLKPKDGSEIDFSYMMKNGRSGKVVIDGQEFELTRGALFLVSAKEKPTRVEQVLIEDGQLQLCEDITKFRDLAKDDDRIAAFLDSCKDKD